MKNTLSRPSLSHDLEKYINLPNALNLSSSSITSEFNDFLHTVQGLVQGLYFCPYLTPGTSCPTGTCSTWLCSVPEEAAERPQVYLSEDIKAHFLDLRIKWHLSHRILDLYKAGPHAGTRREARVVETHKLI